MFTWSISNVLFWESTLQHKKRFWRKHDWPNRPPTLFYHASPCLHNLYGRAAVNVFYFESHTLFYQTWFWSLGNLHFWKFFINMTKTLTWFQQNAWSSIPTPVFLVTLHAYRWIVYRMFATNIVTFYREHNNSVLGLILCSIPLLKLRTFLSLTLHLPKVTEFV